MRVRLTPVNEAQGSDTFFCYTFEDEWKRKNGVFDIEESIVEENWFAIKSDVHSPGYWQLLKRRWIVEQYDYVLPEELFKL